MKTIVFDDTTRDFILDIFNKSVDDDGYVVEKDTRRRVLSPLGEEVLFAEFAGFTPGSEIVLTRDLPTLLQYTNIERGECGSGPA